MKRILGFLTVVVLGASISTCCAADTVKQIADLAKVDWASLANRLRSYANEVEAAQIINIMHKIPELAQELNKVGNLGPLNDVRDLVLKISVSIGEIADMLDSLMKTSEHMRSALKEHGTPLSIRANCLLKNSANRKDPKTAAACIKDDFCVKRGACLKKAIGDLKALLQVLIGETMIAAADKDAAGKPNKPLMAQLVKVYSTIPGTPTQASMLDDLRPVSNVLEIVMSVLDALENIIQE